MLVFLFLPIVGYGAILAAERLMLLLRSMPPLLMLLLRPGAGHELLDLREGLVEAMQAHAVTHVMHVTHVMRVTHVTVCTLCTLCVYMRDTSHARSHA